MYKFRSSTITDKQWSASFNIMSVHLSAFLVFITIFIRHRPKQRIPELWVMATEMVLTMCFFPIKKVFFWNESLTKFRKCLLTPCIHFKFDTDFFSCLLWPVWLVWHNLHLSLHVSWFLPVCTLISSGKPNWHHFPKFKNEILRKKVESFKS